LFEDAEEDNEDVIIENEYDGDDDEEVTGNEQQEAEDYNEEDEEEVVEEEETAAVEPEQTSGKQKKTSRKQEVKNSKQPSPKKGTGESTSQNAAGSSQAAPAAKPKRYSSQRQRQTQQMPLPVHQSMVPQMGEMYPGQAYYEQMSYQGLYVPAGTPPAQSVPMPVIPQQPDVILRQEIAVAPGEQPEIPAGMSMNTAGPQPMGALQHETMMHQQLAALHQGAVAAQQNMGPEGMPPQRVPQPGMSPQQQQALAAHLQMQAQQGVQGPMAPVPQPNMVASGMSPQSTAGFVPGMNVQHPSYTGVQSFAGQPMMYNSSQYPMMNVGMNPFIGQQMYGLPMQGGSTFYPPQAAMMQQQQQQQAQQQSQQPQVEPSQQPQTRRRPTAAIPIKPPQERT